jgi:hypothetical protein
MNNSYQPSYLSPESKQLVIDTAKYILYLICYHDDYKHLNVSVESLRNTCGIFSEKAISGKPTIFKSKKLPNEFNVLADKILKNTKSKEELHALFLNVVLSEFIEK